MKNTIRVVVVDDNTVAVKSIKDHFLTNDSIKVVATFGNGEEALEYLINHNDEVDLVILELLLPRLDGTSLLEEMKSRNLRQKVIVTSGYKDNKIINDCNTYNVSYYLVKPYSMISLDKRVKEIFDRVPIFNAETSNLDLEVSQLLHNLGIPSHIRGYKYIRDSVIIVYNMDRISHITKDVYPQIALTYDTTPSRVERAIRHAIEVSWSRGDINLMEELFGFSISCDKSKPTNSEFITTIADRIKIDNNK